MHFVQTNNMSSPNSPTKTRNESKVLLRSTSFQKLCSIPYNFKIEAIRSYKEHIKTVIKLLKIATRTYVISVYFRIVSIIIFHLRENLLNKGCLTVIHDSSAIATKADDKNNKLRTTNSKSVPDNKTRLKHYEPITWFVLKIRVAAIQTFLTYFCIVYVGFQIVWLMNALFWSANIPFGLMFLIIDLAYMGFIIFKIALNGTNCLP